MKKNVLLCLLIAIAFAACKKDFDVNKESRNYKGENRLEEYEEYYQITDFLDAYDIYIAEGVTGANKRITEAEWLMEAAINMRYGNTPRYVENLESAETTFYMPLDLENTANVVFANMMDTLTGVMDWSTSNLGGRNLFFVDITYAGSANDEARFTITKVWGTITELTEATTSPEPFVSGESYGAVHSNSCNGYYGSAKDQITNRINAATGNFGPTQYYNMIWTNITLAQTPITYSADCGSCACCSTLWGSCNKLWGGNDCYSCLTAGQMNHYMGEAWNLFNSYSLPSEWYSYSFLVSWYGSGDGFTYIPYGGCQYLDYVCSYIYVPYVAKLVPYPPGS